MQDIAHNFMGVYSNLDSCVTQNCYIVPIQILSPHGNTDTVLIGAPAYRCSYWVSISRKKRGEEREREVCARDAVMSGRH